MARHRDSRLGTPLSIAAPCGRAGAPAASTLARGRSPVRGPKLVARSLSSPNPGRSLVSSGGKSHGLAQDSGVVGSGQRGLAGGLRIAEHGAERAPWGWASRACPGPGSSRGCDADSVGRGFPVSGIAHSRRGQIPGQEGHGQEAPPARSLSRWLVPLLQPPPRRSPPHFWWTGAALYAPYMPIRTTRPGSIPGHYWRQRGGSPASFPRVPRLWARPPCEDRSAGDVWQIAEAGTTFRRRVAASNQPLTDGGGHE